MSHVNKIHLLNFSLWVKGRNPARNGSSPRSLPERESKMFRFISWASLDQLFYVNICEGASNEEDEFKSNVLLDSAVKEQYLLSEKNEL
ncbi:hypothetical protein NPIL_573571 [Nephila pilipes]|uniref:Uncharacterized protein n=1 Tax=Nephila pilipes TaxID=299642 RepID=A0A8X6Q0C3_NEPPI|nr:hypothetical protein NPIL_573571 [Nephila pilipes]